MAQEVHQFCSRVKSKPAVIEFNAQNETGDSAMSCSVTLQTLVTELGGYPEMRFQASARSKKLAKGLAMQKAWAFLSSTPLHARIAADHGQVRHSSLLCRSRTPQD
jgi:hypothetical protein